MNAPSTIEIPDTDPLRLAFFEQNELGNAERLKALAKGKLKWVADIKCWAWYDGRRFDTERGAIHAQRLAHDVIRHLKDEADALYELGRRCGEGDADAMDLLTRLKGAKFAWEKLKPLADGLMKHRLKSGSASATNGMLAQARSDLACLSEDFDTDPLVYNCLNRTLRFVETGGKWSVVDSPHDPDDMLMQIADVEFDPSADCPFWRERLEHLHPDGEQLKSLKLLYGSTLSGLTDDQAFYVHQGRGNDGKSATNRAIGQLHGDYFRHSGVKSFLQGAERGGAEHRSDLVRLAGDIRFVTCDEPKERSTWDGETIKQVTGSLITARGSGERTEITYEPHFKLLVECNNIPRPPSDDKGFRRRFKLFQWSVSLPMAGEEGHISLHEVLQRLKAERSGILNWLIEGACAWLETRHVPEPPAMQEVLKDYWAASSQLLDWMDERCSIADPDVRTPSAELYEDFKHFCEARGDEKVMTKTTFGTKLRDKHFAAIKNSSGNIERRGIRLLTESERAARYEAAPVARAAPLPDAERASGPERPFAPPIEDDGEPLP